MNDVRVGRARMVAAVVLLVLTGCGSTGAAKGAGGSTTSAASIASIAKSLKAAVPQVTKVVVLNENNDPNHLIGRPNGYSAAEILVDSRAQCSSGLGVDCGATLEQWSNRSDATSRERYIQSLLKAAPTLGSEWDFVSSTGLLLRVSGVLKPSQEVAYAKAFQRATS